MPTTTRSVATFSAGISPNQKTGITNAARMIRSLNVHENNDYITLNPGATKISSTTVVDLPKWFANATPFTTDKWALGDTGYLYKINSSDVVSVVYTPGALSDPDTEAGQGLLILDDTLYWATSTQLHRIPNLSYGGVTPELNFIRDFGDDGVEDQTQVGTGNTYSLPNSINEAQLITFTPTKDPMDTIAIDLNSKGTGDITVTVHDSVNFVVGSATRTNASLPASGIASFNPSSPLRVKIGNAYHVHVTSSNATGALNVGTAATLSTAGYSEYFSPLIPDSNYHPMINHTDGTYATLLIGNNNYIAQLQPNSQVYNPNKIQLKPGHVIRAFVKDDTYVVALCWNGTSLATAEQVEGYWWDGITPYYNYSRPMTSGQVQSALNFKNRILTSLGTQANLNMGSDPFLTIQPLPTLSRSKTVEVYPGGVGVWQNRAQIATGTTNDSGFYVGVYEYGSRTDKDTNQSGEVLTLGYIMSTGTFQGTTAGVGALLPAGNKMYVGWKDNTTYGIDVIDKTGNAATSGSWESMIDDRGVTSTGTIMSLPLKKKRGFKVFVTFEPLPAGCTVTAKYKADRAASWTTGTAAVANAVSAQVLLGDIGGLDYREIEYGFDVTSSSGNYPIITGVYFTADLRPSDIEETPFP